MGWLAVLWLLGDAYGGWVRLGSGICALLLDLGSGYTGLRWRVDHGTTFRGTGRKGWPGVEVSSQRLWTWRWHVMAPWGRGLVLGA